MSQQFDFNRPSAETAQGGNAPLRRGIDTALNILADKPPCSIDELTFDVVRWTNGGGFRVDYGDTHWLVAEGGFLVGGNYNREAPDRLASLAELLKQAECSPAISPAESQEDLSTKSLAMRSPTPGTLGYVFKEALLKLLIEQDHLSMSRRAFGKDTEQARAVQQEINAIERQLFVLLGAREHLASQDHFVLERPLNKMIAERLARHLMLWSGESEEQTARGILEVLSCL